MKKLTRKSKVMIILLAAILALSGGTAAVIFTVVFPLMPVPMLSEEIYPAGEPTYTVTFIWEQVKHAYGYRIEYKYALYPDEVHTANVKANSATVNRMKGKLWWRVKTLGKTERQDSDFSEWKSFDVPPIPLGEPGRVSYTAVADEVNLYYQIIPETWRNAEYTYFSKVRQIEFYEVAIAAPGVDKELALQDTRFVSAQEFLDEKHPFTSGTWNIYYRAINTKGQYGEFGSLPGEPLELFELFGPGQWVTTQVTVA